MSSVTIGRFSLTLFVELFDLVAVFGGLVVLLVANGLDLQLFLLLNGGLRSEQLFRHMDTLDVEPCSRLVHHVNGFVG